MKKQNYVRTLAIVILNLFLVSQTYASSLEDRVISSGENSGKKLIDVVNSYSFAAGHSKEHIPAKAVKEAFEFYDRYIGTTRSLDTLMYIDPYKRSAPYITNKVTRYTGATLGNKNFILIFDLNSYASHRRLHIINLETGEIDSVTAGHGLGSERGCGKGRACKFISNRESDATPLGFFATGPQFTPDDDEQKDPEKRHQFGIGLYGLEKESPGFEGNDYPSSIVIHDAWYVGPNKWAGADNVGRSNGCVALNIDVMKEWKDKIYGGALFYFYHNQLDKPGRNPAVSGLTGQ